MRPLTIKPIIALAAAFLLAVEGYTIYYCVEKVRHAAGSATTVGDDVVSIGYVTTVASTIFSALAVFFTRNPIRRSTNIVDFCAGGWSWGVRLLVLAAFVWHGSPLFQCNKTVTWQNLLG